MLFVLTWNTADICLFGSSDLHGSTKLLPTKNREVMTVTLNLPVTHFGFPGLNQYFQDGCKF
jgi:hypothetical protein